MSWVGCAQTAAVTHITPLLCKYTAEKTLLYSINASQNLKLEKNLSMRRQKKLTARAHPVSHLLFFSSNPTRGSHPCLLNGNLDCSGSRHNQSVMDRECNPWSSDLKSYAHSVPFWFHRPTQLREEPSACKWLYEGHIASYTSDLWFNILPTALLGSVSFCNWH